MRALVTGAAGFIGSHVVAALVASGAQVRAFDRRAPGDLPAGADFVHGDLLDRDALRRALSGCDAVFHLAALYSYSRRDADAMERVNVEGTRALIEEAGARRVVHTASCATCGPVAGRAATETDNPAAWELRVPYKRTKLAGERLALDAAARGANIVVVNPTTPVGPGDRRPTPTGKMVADVAAGLGQGRQQINFLPEAHTDFIFAVVGEELGMWFTLGVVGVFGIMFVAGLAHLKRAPNLFHFLLAAWCLLLMCLQAIINLGVVTGVLPTKGMSLPFISAGLSNLLLMGLLIGILLNTQRTWGRAALPEGSGAMREVLA